MSASSIADGLRTALRQPAVVLAEIAWRWLFGAAALALSASCLFVYLDTLPITNVELAALASRHDVLVANALGHIFRESGSRLIAMGAILVPAVFVLWIAAAGIGRAATLKALLRREESVSLFPQFGLTFLRAGTVLASLVGYCGAAIIAGRAAAGEEPHPGIFLSIFLLLAVLITVLRSRLNWFCHLASIYAAREGHDAFSSISDAVAMFHQRAGACVATGVVFGAVHTMVFVSAGIAGSLALSALAGNVPVGVTAAALALVAIVYFAICDFLYVARLAAYVSLAEADRNPPPVLVEPQPAPPVPDLPVPIPELPPVLPETAGSS